MNPIIQATQKQLALDALSAIAEGDWALLAGIGDTCADLGFTDLKNHIDWLLEQVSTMEDAP